ncbi:MAG: TIGR00730 family Rossman fold protein [Gemmatimonadota bacterium]
MGQSHDGSPWICVYCGSKSGREPVYARAAVALGQALAGRGFGLVYGGGNVGLMGALADAVLSRGGQVVGVIPRALVQQELAHRGLTELVVVADMHARKAQMAARASAFAALPGGYGTLEELFEVVAWAQLEIHTKPVGLLNAGGYFDQLVAFLDQAVERDFLRPRHRALLRVAADPEALVDELALLLEGGDSAAR